MATPMRAILARRLNITDELKANIRHRYEHTPESLSTMAADLGCTGQTVCNLAKREGWVRYVPPPRDLSPAARLLARAEKVAEQGAAALSLPPKPVEDGRERPFVGGGLGRGVAASGQSDGRSTTTPTPNPSPPRAAHVGEGSHLPIPPNRRSSPRRPNSCTAN